jgi:hypothetical protein
MTSGHSIKIRPATENFSLENQRFSAKKTDPKDPLGFSSRHGRKDRRGGLKGHQRPAPAQAPPMTKKAYLGTGGRRGSPRTEFAHATPLVWALCAFLPILYGHKGQPFSSHFATSAICQHIQSKHFDRIAFKARLPVTACRYVP